MNVEALMNRHLSTCGPRDSLNDAAFIMWERDCGVVPIVEEDQRLVGVVTDRDVAMAAYTQGRLLKDIPIWAVMSSGVVTCRPGDSLAEAEDRMRGHQLHRLPVIEGDGKLVGLITLSDLVREAAAEEGHWRRDVTAGEVVATMAAVVSPRLEAPRLGS